MFGSENWALNRSETRKIETAEMRFWGVSLVTHRPCTQHDNTYFITYTCVRGSNPRLQKTSDIIVSYEWAPLDWTRTLIITNQKDKEILDNQEDDGRIVFEKKRLNKSPPWSRRWWWPRVVNLVTLLGLRFSNFEWSEGRPYMCGLNLILIRERHLAT
jgi:hypothetical protein